MEEEEGEGRGGGRWGEMPCMSLMYTVKEEGERRGGGRWGIKKFGKQLRKARILRIFRQKNTRLTIVRLERTWSEKIYEFLTEKYDLVTKDGRKSNVFLSQTKMTDFLIGYMSIWQKTSRISEHYLTKMKISLPQQRSYQQKILSSNKKTKFQPDDKNIHQKL